MNFAFTDFFEMFTRETEKTTRTGKLKISFAEFAIYHSAEPLFQQIRVNTSFDHLDYNFFAEQFSKVKLNTTKVTRVTVILIFYFLLEHRL
jgi:hypothetical protein